MLGEGGASHLKGHGVGVGVDVYSTENYLHLHITGRWESSKIKGYGVGGGKNFRSTPHGHFKWNGPNDYSTLL